MGRKKSPLKIGVLIALFIGASLLGVFGLLVVADYFLFGGNDPRCNEQGIRDLDKLVERLELDGISDHKLVGFSNCDSGGVPSFETYTALSESDAVDIVIERWGCNEFNPPEEWMERTFSCRENGQTFTLELETGADVRDGERFIGIFLDAEYENTF